MTGDPRAVDARHARGVQAGDGNVQFNVYAARREIDWPHRVGVVPPLADARQDRPADAALHTATTDGGAVVVCQVLTGLGGVGKTQLAAALARRMWQRGALDLLVWVSATSRSAVLTGYAQAAADVTGIEDPDPEQGAARFLAWLASTERRWLVVLDDLADPDDLRGLWPPTTGSGRSVVTTRRRDAALVSGRRVVDVGLFTPAESVAYLRAKLGDDPGRLEQAAQLADDLGHLPLALAQAAAYILDRRSMSCAGYRRRLADRARRLIDLSPSALPDDHPDPVAVTWSLSIERADTSTPHGLSRPVLELAALLDPNDIPAELFTTNAVLRYLATRTSAEAPVAADDATDALDNLDRLNLISQDPASRQVRVHGLLQRVVREATPTEHAGTLAVTAADALVEIWPEIERDRELGQILRANTAVLASHADPLLWDPDTGGHQVLFTAGHSFGESGLTALAVDHFRALHATAVQRLGPDHSDALSTRGNLAYSQGEAGDPASAAAAFADLFQSRLRILGPDHPHTLITRGNLARWQGEAGNPTAAATALAELLQDCLRILGPDHPDTLITRNNLAHWRGKAGDPASAAAAFADLFQDRLRILGPDHPHTLTTRANLARWQGEAGNPTAAATALAELLQDRLRILGPDHPHTLTTRANLARWQGEAGNPTAAAIGFTKLLEDVLRVLGPDHPHTLTTRHNLAHWRERASSPAQAPGEDVAG